MSVESFRVALAAALDGMPNLRCPSAYMTDQVNPPQAMIDHEVNYDLTFARGADVHTFHVMVFDLRTSERATQIRFDTLMDGSLTTTSIKFVVENNAGVAAECDYARVLSATRPQVATIGVVDYLLVDFTLEVVL